MHSDYPLEDPADDLLGMASQARTLARVLNGINPPYTIGIYGKWGEGKTTYANLLIKYLAQQPHWAGMNVVRFSAWPYVTADAMWRALLDRVAYEILDPDHRRDAKAAAPPAAEKEQPPSREVAASTTWTFLRRILLADVLTIRGGKEADPKRQQYERLRKRFDRSAALANRTPIMTDGST